MLKKRNEFDPYSNDYPITPKEHVSSASGSGKETTVIGENISIDGTIRAKEDLLIQGTLKGAMELDKHHVTIGPKGKIDADIQADRITISGRMHGNVMVTGKVEITKEADFTGQIKAKSIAIEDGAYIKASIEMQRDEEKKAPTADMHREEEKKAKPVGKRPIEAVVIDKQTPTIAPDN